MAFDRHKNNKLLYYSKGFGSMLLPGFLFRQQLKKYLQVVSEEDEAYIQNRVTYYNKLHAGIILPAGTPPLKELRLGKKLKTYFLDSKQIIRYFPQHWRAAFLFGDVTHVPLLPTIVKSRPIGDGNENSVLLKLDKVRHFTFTKDRMNLAQKSDSLVWRGHAHNDRRVSFIRKYQHHPMCDVGQINQDVNSDIVKPRLTIDEHLKHKFILCLEGNDVASNLKWVMSSHSIAVMPKPKFETWFMEGRLEAGKHYICIAEDFSDLEQKLQYYINHPHEAAGIVQHANDYIAQFKNEPRELRIAIRVMQKYFTCTGQIS